MVFLIPIFLLMLLVFAILVLPVTLIGFSALTDWLVDDVLPAISFKRFFAARAIHQNANEKNRVEGD